MSKVNEFVPEVQSLDLVKVRVTSFAVEAVGGITMLGVELKISKVSPAA